MDLNSIFKKLFPTRERFDRYLLYLRQQEEEAIRQARMDKQAANREVEMIQMTTEYDDIDFDAEADEIWETIKPN